MYVINHINIAITKRWLKIKIRFSRRVITLVKLLYRLGILKSFLILSSGSRKFIIMSPVYYKTSPYFKHIKLISTLSKKFFVTYQILRILERSTYSGIYILSTSQGLRSHRECLRLKIGGVLLCTAL